MRTHVARGVRFRRARVVSEPGGPISSGSSTRGTAGLNIAAGEEVRWLPRRRASDLCLPGNDFWVFDDHTDPVRVLPGDGELVGHEVCRDPDVLKLCLSAFEAVWDRAIPHEGYRPQ